MGNERNGERAERGTSGIGEAEWGTSGIGRAKIHARNGEQAESGGRKYTRGASAGRLTRRVPLGRLGTGARSRRGSRPGPGQCRSPSRADSRRSTAEAVTAISSPPGRSTLWDSPIRRRSVDLGTWVGRWLSTASKRRSVRAAVPSLTQTSHRSSTPFVCALVRAALTASGSMSAITTRTCGHREATAIPIGP